MSDIYIPYFDLRFNTFLQALEYNNGAEMWLPVPVPSGDIGLSNGQMLVGNASNVATPVTISGDITISNTGVSSIGSDKITTTMLQALSVTSAKLAASSVIAGKIGTGAVTPTTISTSGSDDFAFPHDVTIAHRLGVNSAGIPGLDFQVGNPSAGSAFVDLQAAAGNQVSIIYRKGAALEWILLKNTDETFGIFDGIASRFVLQCTTGSGVTIPRLYGSMGMNNTNADAAASAKLDIASTTQGFLMPRMTTTQRNAISSPVEGLMVYDTTLFQTWQYQNSAWAAVGGGSAAGTDTQVQFNDGGTAFGGSSKLTFNKSTGDLTLGNSQKIVFGNSGTAFLEYDSVNAEYLFNQDATELQFGTSGAGLNIYVRSGAGTHLPQINMGANTSNGSGIELATTSFQNPDFRLETSGEVNIGSSTSHVSSLLSVTSTTKGFLPSRMTTTQKNAISSPAEGLVVYDTTLHKLCVFTTGWETIVSA